MACVAFSASLLLAALLSVPVVFGEFAAYQIGLYLIYGIAAQGIGLLWGKTGILPLGQALFFGVSAYAAAIALKTDIGLLLQLSLALAVLGGIAVFSFVLAALIFRGRSESGPYFSLMTLALVMIAEQVAGTATDLTGGFNGLSGYHSLGNLDPFGGFYFVIVAAAVAVTVLLLVLNRLPVNLIARAVADNEPRLQLLGFPTHMVKGAAFALSAVIAALAGGLFASHQGIVTPTSTGFVLSAELVIFAAVGGRFHVFGPLVGAVLVGWTAAELRASIPYWEMLIALAFILVVLKAPGGIAEIVKRGFRRIQPKKVSLPSFSLEAPPARLSGGSGSLRFEDVSLRVGVVRILDGVSFEMPAKGIVGVIGPNGAGKTSLLDTVTGRLRLTGGRIMLGEARIDSRPLHLALGSGIGRKLQVPSVFQSLSVSENISIAMMANRVRMAHLFRRSTFRWRSDSLRFLLEHPAFPLCDELAHPVGQLPQGHRQFLEYAMTVAAAPPVLLLDEPCAGLSAAETELMAGLIRDYQQAKGGLTVVVEHDMSLVEAISDLVLVLHLGQVLALDTFENIRNRPDVQAVYSGGTK